MTVLVKRAGAREEFDPVKLQTSLRKAGVSERDIRDIVSRINPAEGETTASLRWRIIRELRMLDSSSAKRYESVRQLRGSSSSRVPLGQAWIHPETLRNLELRVNDQLRLENGSRYLTVRVEESPATERRDVQLNAGTLNSLGTTRGMKLAIRRWY